MTKEEFNNVGLNIAYGLEIDSPMPLDEFLDKFYEAIKEFNDELVDIGYYLEYCGHRVIKNVYNGGYAYDHDHIYCTTADAKNQYTLPINSIEFIIPHIDKMEK
jgi:hypothetical protein